MADPAGAVRQGGRARRATFWVTAAASAGALIAGGSELAGLYKSPTWVSLALIVAGALGASSAPVLEARAARREKEEADSTARGAAQLDRQRTIRECLTVSGHPPEVLPRVRDVSPYGEVGVSRSIYSAAGREEPYAPREVDSTIDAALRESNFVIVVGDSKAGKSRSSYEALLRTMPDSQIVVPSASPGALRIFVDLQPPAWSVEDRQVVLWLDDVDRYLGGSNSLDSTFLDQVDRQSLPLLVVGTLTSQRREHFLSATGEVGRATRLVIERANQVWMEPRLTDKEYADAQLLYPELVVERAFAEQMVAAPMLKRKYYDGRSSRPAGWAIVQAAVDWRRTGLTRPATEDDLKRLYAIYLANRPDIDPDDALFAEGLRWAREPVAADAALLRRAPAGPSRQFAIFDYVVALADGQGDRPYQEIPTEVWRCVISLGTPLELVDIGTTALSRQHYAVAQEAFQVAIDSGDLVAGALAANELGLIVEMEEHDEVLAEKLYRQAMACGPFVEGNAWAANNLGNLLSRQGKLDEAMEMFRLAIIPENSQHSIPANSLGEALRGRGRNEEAKEAFRTAIRSGQTRPSVTMAALNLGEILEEEGDEDGAAEAYRLAMAHPYEPAAAGWAGYQLGALHERAGRLESAQAAYREVIEGGFDESAASCCAFNLAEMALAGGDEAGAIDLYQAAVVEANPELSIAALTFGRLLRDRGDVAEAEQCLDLAASANRPAQAARLASLELGDLLREQGDLAAAEARYRFAADSPDADEITEQATAQLRELGSEPGG